MSGPFVLVHGGGFAASCWERLVPLLDGRALAVDLPGRASRPADLASVTADDLADAVVDEVVKANLSEVVLVGHSLAGITLPGVAARIPERLRRLVFVSCAVPPDGSRVFDILDPEMQAMVDEASPPVGDLLDATIAKSIFCNDMDEEQTGFTLGAMVPESSGLIFERVGLGGLHPAIPRTYVRLLADVVLPPDKQDRMIANMGGASTVDLDAGHMVMISRPGELADTLNEVGASREAV